MLSEDDSLLAVVLGRDLAIYGSKALYDNVSVALWRVTLQGVIASVRWEPVPSSTRVACLQEDGCLCILDVDQPPKDRHVPIHEGVACFDWDPKGSVLAACCKNHVVFLQPGSESVLLQDVEIDEEILECEDARCPIDGILYHVMSSSLLLSCPNGTWHNSRQECIWMVVSSLP